MSRLKQNLLANFVGVGWSALMQLAFVPLYIKFMGVEAYGLVGLFMALRTTVQVFDFGLSPTMNRELARYSTQPEKAAEARDFVRTLEVGYWPMGIVIGVAVLAAAPLVANHWIRATAIPVGDVRQAVMIMGVLVALQWPLSFYQGGLMGLQRQVLLNGVRIAITTLSSAGAALIVWRISPTIMAFLSWEIVASTIHVMLVTVLLWHHLPSAGRSARFDPGLVRKIWRFAAGLGAISVSALILTQLDKILLSRLLSLEMFGYYTLAGVVAKGLYTFINPVFDAVFPRLSALVMVGDEDRLKALYHRSSQLMAVLILPISSVLTLFSFDILVLWTGSADTARYTAPLAAILVAGTALNGLMYIPYALQLAYGWTRLGLCINTFFIFTLVPAIFFLTKHYGAVGGAAVWVALNAIYILIGVPLTHRRVLKREASRWFVEDVGRALVVAVLVTLVGRKLMVAPLPGVVAVGSLAMVLLAASVGATLAAPEMRVLALSRLSKWRMMKKA